MLNERVVELRREGKDFVKVKNRSGLGVSSKIVIDAKGMNSLLLYRFTGNRTARNYWIPVTQFWVKDHELDPRHVYIFLKSMLRNSSGTLYP